MQTYEASVSKQSYDFTRQTSQLGDCFCEILNIVCAWYWTRYDAQVKSYEKHGEIEKADLISVDVQVNESLSVNTVFFMSHRKLGHYDLNMLFVKQLILWWYIHVVGVK